MQQTAPARMKTSQFGTSILATFRNTLSGMGLNYNERNFVRTLKVDNFNEQSALEVHLDLMASTTSTTLMSHTFPFVDGEVSSEAAVSRPYINDKNKDEEEDIEDDDNDDSFIDEKDGDLDKKTTSMHYISSSQCHALPISSSSHHVHSITPSLWVQGQAGIGSQHRKAPARTDCHPH